MNASSRCCPAVRMPPRDQDVHHRRSYRDRRGTFRTLAHPAAAGWSLPRSQGRHWRMTEQDNADALDGFPRRQYGAPRSDVTQPKAGGQVTTQGTGLPTKSALRATSPGDRYSRRTPAMLVPLWPHRLRLHPRVLSRRTVGHPRPATAADERRGAIGGCTSAPTATTTRPTAGAATSPDHRTPRCAPSAKQRRRTGPR